MRRVPKSGPALSFKPDDAVTFKHAKSENGVEVLQDTIEITNSSSRTVHFRFADDPEFKFSPHAGFIAPQSTTVVIVTFFNVDGHCQPRRSSVVLRSIRVRSEDQQEVERLWKRTPTELIGEKRWKLQFEKDQLLATAPSTMPCTGREPLSSKATTGAGDGKWIANTAKTGKSRLPAATLATECGNWLLRFQLQFAVIVMGAVVLSAYYSWGIAKSRHAPDTPDSAHTRMSHSAEANKSSPPAATEATECARWLVLTELLLTIAVVMDAYLALWLVKSKKAPDVPDAPSLTDRSCSKTSLAASILPKRYKRLHGWLSTSRQMNFVDICARSSKLFLLASQNTLRDWAAYAGNTSKSWLSAATRAVQCARRPLRSRRLLAVVVMCAVVPTAYHELWVAKSTHVQDAPDSAHTWTTYSVGATKPSLPAAARAVECAGWRLLSQLLLVIVILIGACLGLCILKSKRAPDVPRTPSLTDTELSLTSSSCAFWTLDSMRKDMWVKYGAPAIKLRLAAVTRALKYAGWFLRSQLLWAVIVIVPVVLTACYALWVFKHRHVPHSEDCVTIGGKTYCF